MARMPAAPLGAPAAGLELWCGDGWQAADGRFPRALWSPARGWRHADPDCFWGPAVHYNRSLDAYVMLLNQRRAAPATSCRRASTFPSMKRSRTRKAGVLPCRSCVAARGTRRSSASRKDVATRKQGLSHASSWRGSQPGPSSSRDMQTVRRSIVRFIPRKRTSPGSSAPGSAAPGDLMQLNARLAVWRLHRAERCRMLTLNKVLAWTSRTP